MVAEDSRLVPAPDAHSDGGTMRVNSNSTGDSGSAVELAVIDGGSTINGRHPPIGTSSDEDGDQQGLQGRSSTEALLAPAPSKPGSPPTQSPPFVTNGPDEVESSDDSSSSSAEASVDASAVSGGRQDPTTALGATTTAARPLAASPAPDVAEAQRLQPHCDDEHTFKLVEAGRRKTNSARDGQEKIFLSHCWRNPATQYKKRQIVASLSTPVEEGGPGLVYWGDFLDLQAEGPVPWRREIEEGIQGCSKFVVLLDKAWLTSYNCLQELAMAMEGNKPAVVLVLDQEAWELLTVPGGAAKAKSEADANLAREQAWTDSQYGIPLCTYDGEDIVPGRPMSLGLVTKFFNHLGSINLCPCRPLEEENAGYKGLLGQAVQYVQKDLAYYKDFAQLRNKAAAWRKAVHDGAPKPLLQAEEATHWRQWLEASDKYEREPRPTDEMHELVQVSGRHSARRRLALRLVAVLLVVVLAGGITVSTVMAVRATAAEGEAAEQALVARQNAKQAEISSRHATGLASASAINSLPYSSDWQLKLLRQATELLPTPASQALNSTLLAAGRSLLQKPGHFMEMLTEELLASGDSVAWSPTGEWIAYAMTPNQVGVLPVKQWRIVTESLQVLKGHTNVVWSLAWAADGSMLASASYDSTVRLWSLAGGEFSAARVLRGGYGTMYAVAWAPSGRALATGSIYNVVEVWSVAGASGGFADDGVDPDYAILQGHTDAVQALAWSPDGSTLASGSGDGSVRVWAVRGDGAPGSTALAILQTSADVACLEWAPDGSVLAVATSDGSLEIWSPLAGAADPSEGWTSRTYPAHADQVAGLSWAPDGSSVATAGLDMLVKVWPVSQGSVVSGGAVQVLEGNPTSQLDIAWAPDGVHLVMAARELLCVWNVRRDSVGENVTGQTLPGHTDIVWTAAASPEGNAIASASLDGTIRMWTQEQPGAGFEYSVAIAGPSRGHVWSLAWRPQGGGALPLLASGWSDGVIRLWEIDPQGRPIPSSRQELPAGDADVLSVCWSPDGQQLAVAVGNQSLVWPVASAGLAGASASGSTPLRLAGHSGPVLAQAWSPDGATLATGSRDSSVRLWQVPGDGTGAAVQSLIGHQDAVTCVAWAPDGSSLASSSADMTVRLWSLALPQGQDEGPPQVLQGHSDGVWSVAWAPDGSRLASASTDGNIYVWAVAKENAIAVAADNPLKLSGHSGPVWAVCWLPGGTTVLSASSDSTVRLWQMLTVQSMADALDEFPLRSWAFSETELASKPIPATLSNFGEPVPPNGQEATVQSLQGTEMGVLMDFKRQQKPWTLTSWNVNKPMCTWEGISCNGQGEVDQLRLAATQLSGSLPPEWSNLKSLTAMWLVANGFTGTLPESWSALTNLTVIGIKDNRFLTGSVPESWSALQSLYSLHLNGNDLTGTLPKAWSALSGMSQLLMFGNHFTGPLPSTWSTMARMSELFLDGNRFTGSLPESWSALTSATAIFVFGNRLIGSLPESWSTLTSLAQLGLYKNRLTGTLPNAWSSLTSLSLLHLYANYLSGSLPEEWSTMTHISIMVLNSNLLDGALPGAWGALELVSQLQLYDNHFTGSLPVAWSNLQSIGHLDLRDNELQGSLPPEWSALATVEAIYLSTNQLTGSLPEAWSVCATLSHLALDANRMTGTLPEPWSALTSLAAIGLYGSELTGTAPAAWSSLSSLELMGFWGNDLSGSLPESWSTLSSLATLDLGDNRFNGTLSASWSALGSLTNMYLKSNLLSGPLPEAWSAMSQLDCISLPNNRLTGSLPIAWSALQSTTTVELFQNALTGPIPKEWSNMAAMESMYLDDNQLTSSLPNAWSNLLALQRMHLYHNKLTGSMPETWSSLQNLSELYIDNNQLSGSLPEAWSALASLSGLHVYSNMLTGTLPGGWSALSPWLDFRAHDNDDNLTTRMVR